MLEHVPTNKCDALCILEIYDSLSDRAVLINTFDDVEQIFALDPYQLSGARPDLLLKMLSTHQYGVKFDLDEENFCELSPTSVRDVWRQLVQKGYRQPHTDVCGL